MESPPTESFADLVEPSDEPEQDDLRLRSLAIDIFLHPVSAMRRLAAHPGKRWLWPLLLLVVISVVATVVALPDMVEYQQQVSRQETMRMFEENPEMFSGQSPDEVLALTTGAAASAARSGFSLIGIVMSVLLGTVVVAAIFHFLGTVLGGQQSFLQMFTIVSWAHMPFVLRELVRTGRNIIWGFDPHPRGLTGLVACDPLDPSAVDCQRSFLEPIYAQLEIWNLWYWALLVIGIAIVSHVSRRKAFFAVAVLVLLQVLLGLSGVFVGRQLSGFFG